ncbi:aldehyde dehydrogenase (NADP(+)) [Blastococcus jejuensis]|uniref:Aldehyde dehydrogenase (NADP(+)) n=1 Tax=Blastococcus jejuensis TaxID=351224 RepID=A0ABP6NXN1_9ACTN
MTVVASIDPRTGTRGEVVAEETGAAELDRLCRAAADAAGWLEAAGRDFRAGLLRRMADALEARGEDIVATADRETAIGPTRLGGELRRTCYQLRLFAEVLEEGSYLEATIDPPGETPMGPRPDLRRMLVPIGPVAVFGASNFPLAFSVPGGDTASALAVGCPVVIKAHESHPATSELCFSIMRGAADELGCPEGTLSLVHGRQAGADLVSHPEIRAVAFTGSPAGGRALFDLINRRPDPIPFYGELGSINPVIVTPGAADERAAAIAEGLVGSFTVAAGQLCTKPGVVLVPRSAGGDALVEAVSAAVGATGDQVLLNERIAADYASTTGRLRTLPSVSVVAQGEGSAADGFRAAPLLLSVDVENLDDAVTGECFGPMTVLVRYDGEDELAAAVAKLPSSLTAAVHSAPAEGELTGRLTDLLRRVAGRLIYDGFPTGVSVSWAQHHGGPWPATNSLHTSVGTSAVRRFLRPTAWQDAPQHVLPAELRDGSVDVPRRIDGRLQLPE